MGKDNFDDIAITDVTVKAVADQFLYYMRDGFEEAQRIGMDYQNAFAYVGEPMVCASHDYCDANITMSNAFEEALVDAGVDRSRASAFMGACDDDATPEAQERRNVAWGQAWRSARETGFSYMKAQLPLEDFKVLAPCLLWPPESTGHSVAYPSAPDTPIARIDRTAQDLTDAIERDEVPGGKLVGIADALRAGNDARLTEILDETLGADRNATPAW